jgi:hypothetical protein
LQRPQWPVSYSPARVQEDITGDIITITPLIITTMLIAITIAVGVSRRRRSGRLQSSGI